LNQSIQDWHVIIIAADPNVPHALMIQLRDRMDLKLWDYTRDLWAAALKFRYMDQDVKPTTHRTLLSGKNGGGGSSVWPSS